MILNNAITDHKANKAIIDTIEMIRKDFPKNLLSAYLTGSYANNYSVSTSDIDLCLVFNEDLSPEDFQLADKINADLELKDPSMDIAFYSLDTLLELGVYKMEETHLHLWGEPVHLKIPTPTIEDYSYRQMHGAYMRMALTRKKMPFIFPLEYPKNESKYKGYDWRTMPIAGKSIPSIKEIVVSTGWMATALISWKGKTFVANKKECPRLFQQFIGGQSAEEFQDIVRFAREHLHYCLPSSEIDEKYLISLLPKVLKFENAFLEAYQYFLISNLNNPNSIRVQTSIIRLGEIKYPNNLSHEALSNFLPQNESQEKALLKTMTFLSDNLI